MDLGLREEPPETAAKNAKRTKRYTREKILNYFYAFRWILSFVRDGGR